MLVDRSLRRVPTFLWWVAGAALAATTVFVRQPPAARNVLWAEDGGIFLQQALQPGGVSLLAPYEGYLHVIPRLGALIVSGMPPAAYAIGMNALSSLALGLIAVMVFHCAESLDSRFHVRAALASIVVLIGAGPLETTGNFANLHWYLLFLTPWILFKRAETRAEALLLFGVAALTATTEILAAIFAPLILVRWRDRAYWPARIGLLLGLACQFVATLVSPRTDNTLEPATLTSIVIGWFVNGPGVLVYGTGSELGGVVANFGWMALAVAALPFLVAFGLILWKGNPRHRLTAITMLGSSVVVWVAIQVVNPAPFFAYAEFSAQQWRQAFPSRYAVPTSMFVLSLVPIMLAILPRSRTAAKWALVGVFITLNAGTFLPSYTARLEGPDWQQAVTQATESCSGQAAGGEVALPIAPAGWFADELIVPCRRLG
jgi:hypothetical protein